MQLFLTFPTTSTNGIKAITLLPRNDASTAGRFRVWLWRGISLEEEHDRLGKNSWGAADLVWDRKVEGGFPELKALKQRIRDLIDAEKSLGHSDRHPVVPASDNVASYEPTFKCA